jgi:hypothetical protein
MPLFSESSTACQSQDVASSHWRESIPRRLIEFVLLALVLLVISLHLNYVWKVRAAVPHQDDWSLLDEMFQSFDTHRVGAWIFHSRNGHFVVPANLAYLVSFRYLSLDLTPLRFLNFPIFLLAFLLTAHVINIGVSSRFRRFYLYLGACFPIFNFCHWGHFTVGAGFTTILSAVFGGIGLYYIAKAMDLSRRRGNSLAIGFGSLVLSILSFGTGYAATAAAILLFALVGLKKLTPSRPVPGFDLAVYCSAFALGLLAIVSYPLNHLNFEIINTVFHTVLIAGSVCSSLFDDKNSVMAQNVAFVGGLILVFASLLIGGDFTIKQTRRPPVWPIFSVALTLFGLFGCVAVAVSRSHLPEGDFLSTRYTLYPSICLLGILLYFSSSGILLLTSMWCFAAAGYLVGAVNELQIAPYRPAAFESIERAIRNIDKVSDEELQGTLFWWENTEAVRRVVERMRRDRLNVFRGNNRNTSEAQH